MSHFQSSTQKYLLFRLAELQVRKESSGGYALVATVAMIIILSGLFVTASIVGSIDSTTTRASEKSSQGFFAAEAGLNIRARDIKSVYVGFERPTGDEPTDIDSDGAVWDTCLDSSATNSQLGTGNMTCDSSLRIQNQQIVTYVKPLNSKVGGVLQPSEITIPDNEPFGGLLAQEYSFEVESVALDNEQLPTAILGMRFKSRLVPMFQFLSFFDKDFELAYPPTMNLEGPIHSNGDLYLNSQSGRTLTINGRVTTPQTLYRGLKFNGTCGGTVSIHTSNTGSSTANLNCPSPNGSRLAFTDNSSLGAWNNRVLVNSLELEVPELDEFAPVPGKQYWDQSDIRLVVNVSGASPVIEVRDPDNSVNSSDTDILLETCPTANTTLTANADSSTTTLNVTPGSTSDFSVGDLIRVGNDDDTNVIESKTSSSITLKYALGTTQAQNAAVRKSIIATTNTFFNNREKRGGTGSTIRMLEVDVQGLLDCADAESSLNMPLNDASQGGLVWYLTVQDNANLNGLNTFGVRVRNGAELASSGGTGINGLTVVSDQGLYVQGNYNSTNKKPASFLVDTINILSNNWEIIDDDDSQEPVQDGTRDATATTVNAAFLSGSDTTGGTEGSGGQGGGFNASYGGGFENFPRFHEDWGGINFNYRGSFVSLDKPQKYNGPWCGTGNTCNIYVPPNRNWNFDTDYRVAANLPPMSPRAVFLRQELFQRDFTRAAQPREWFTASNFIETQKVSSISAISPNSYFIF